MGRNLVSSCLAMLLALSVRAEVVDIDNATLARLAAAGVPVIDIRTAGEWNDTGIIPGSKLLTFFDGVSRRFREIAVGARVAAPAWRADSGRPRTQKDFVDVRA